MVIPRFVLFLSLLLLCVAASSINLNQSTRREYSGLEWLAQTGETTRAEAGFRDLAMQYPYTVAGVESIRRLVKNGESLPGLVMEILFAGIKNTTAAEWLVFLSALLVMTVFMAGNSLPTVIGLLFIISGAGMFHLSHPLIPIQSGALDIFLAVNPYLYAALTLLIAGGCLHYRWRAARWSASAPGADLTLREQLLMRKIYLEKLKVIQKRAKGVEKELRSPQGRHFVNELNRIFGKLQEEQRIITDELESFETQNRKTIRNAERSTDQAKEALKESRILLRSKAIDPETHKRFRLEKNAAHKKSQNRASEVNATEKKAKKVHFITRLQFMRLDLFQAWLHRAYIDRKQSAVKVVQGNSGLFPPKIAKKDLRNLKIADRLRTRVNAKMVRLEEGRKEMNALEYREKMKSLLKEKKIRDKALLESIGKISSRMDLCKNKKERLESAIQTLTDEMADMKTLGRINGLFPALVRVQRVKIRQAKKSARKALPDLRKIETIYREAPTEPREPD